MPPEWLKHFWQPTLFPGFDEPITKGRAEVQCLIGRFFEELVQEVLAWDFDITRDKWKEYEEVRWYTSSVLLKGLYIPGFWAVMLVNRERRERITKRCL